MTAKSKQRLIASKEIGSDSTNKLLQTVGTEYRKEIHMTSFSKSQVKLFNNNILINKIKQKELKLATSNQLS